MLNQQFRPRSVAPFPASGNYSGTGQHLFFEDAWSLADFLGTLRGFVLLLDQIQFLGIHSPALQVRCKRVEFLFRLTERLHEALSAEPSKISMTLHPRMRTALTIERSLGKTYVPLMVRKQPEIFG